MEIRLTNNNPGFERIRANRKARRLKFNGKVFFWVVLITLPVYGFGLILWIIALVINIK